MRKYAKIIGVKMIIERPRYLNKLVEKRENGFIKVISGVRRCGKSYLLTKLYRNYLNSEHVENKHIIELALDEIQNAKYRNPLELDRYIRSQITDDKKMYYVFLDEIQAVSEITNPYLNDKKSKIGFVDVVLGLMKIKNVDLYITGSNSKMLSSDIVTEFRDRGDEIKVNPLTYKEYSSVAKSDKRNTWNEYFTYGGMPAVLTRKTHEDKSKYLKDLFTKTYITDVIERHSIKNEKEVLEELMNIISSSIGSLTNPTKLSNTFKTVKKIQITPATISTYLDYFVDAFILCKSYRYDIKGKKYIDTPLKYYFTDVGLRNARLNFRQQEENHIMENVIYNELTARAFNIDVGVVEYNSKNKEGKSQRNQLEVDFIANKGNKRFYIQSVLSVSEEEKRKKETNSLYRIDDSFRKIIVIKDDIFPWHDEKGVYYIGIEQFLLDESVMDL